MNVELYRRSRFKSFKRMLPTIGKILLILISGSLTIKITTSSLEIELKNLGAPYVVHVNTSHVATLQ